MPCRGFAEVADAVECGEASLGLLPIENTLAGSVVGSYDVLADHASLHVVAEVVAPIHHCVVALPDAALEELASIESHPLALAQCGRWLRAHPRISPRAAYDTAGAARDVATRGDRRAAAIASRAAAARYGLAVLAHEIQDRADNQTRFLAISRDRLQPPTGARARTALLLTVANVPGALLHVLEPIALNGMNMSKVESRPTGEPWHYRFFIEIDHAGGDARAARAVEGVRRVSESLRVLGTYARWRGKIERPSGLERPTTRD